ncbi:uncharacterized protein CMU_026940 [Cryptosporidium muris RN66]|uniref:Endoplasmic reticulum-Golgi intermediate compartment protein 3 n=1 Tax=Cryptosporidium muris (strain RN66) TaxID=441375 RepID=B6ABD4_CRYMR|nr:uncharacterized protein CMU_026940 [Cryptosporidium muris RN66]EEA05686.1 hypothetical protein, conserved [Cryptosporidium muris RN66]|eukprot:XP_002140035.1 hypothetical protein [Cryptosporidium muris RN66]
MQRFDAFSKPIAEFRIKTAFGGYLTILSILTMLFLFYSELRYYLKVNRNDEITVDKTLAGGNVNIKMLVEFPKLPCEVVGLRILNTQDNTEFSHPKDSIIYIPINPLNEESNIGSSCGSCYNPSKKNHCCNTCSEVIRSYQEDNIKLPQKINFEQCKFDPRERLEKAISAPLNISGCKIKVDINIPKVKGRIEISHKRWMNYNEMTNLDISEAHLYNFSYIVKYLHYGDDLPGINNIWNNQEYIQTAKFTHNKESDNLFLEDAHLDIDMHCIPTQFNSINSKKTKIGHQFSVRKQSKQVNVLNNGRFVPETSLPGIYINYDFTPFIVKITESRRSFLSFLTECCAIIGGIFAFSSMIDIFMFKLSSFLNRIHNSNNKHVVLQNF